MGIIKNSEIQTKALGDGGEESKTSNLLFYPSDNNLKHRIVFKIVTKKGMEGLKASSKGDDQAKVEKLKTETPTVIVLAHPNDLSSSYNQTWDSGEGYYNNVSNKSGGLDTDGVLSIVGALAKQAGAGTARGIGSAILADDISLAEGVAVNPFLGVSYKSPTLRTVEYSFPMMPKNRKEVEECLAIIHAFKYHSSPSFAKDDGSGVVNKIKETLGNNEDFNGIIDKAVLKYPDFFYMESYMGSEKNETIPKFGPAVCTNVSTNYSPQGLWRTFESGAPVNMMLTLSFQEMEIITREKLMKGY